MIRSDNSIQINIKFTFTVHVYIIVYEYIWIYSIIQFNIYILCIYIWTLCFLFIATLSQLIRTMVTPVSPTDDLFQLSLPVETSYTIANLHKILFCSRGEVLTGFKHSFKKQLRKVVNIFHFKLIHPCCWIHILGGVNVGSSKCMIFQIFKEVTF